MINPKAESLESQFPYTVGLSKKISTPPTTSNKNKLYCKGHPGGWDAVCSKPFPAGELEKLALWVSLNPITIDDDGNEANVPPVPTEVQWQAMGEQCKMTRIRCKRTGKTPLELFEKGDIAHYLPGAKVDYVNLAVKKVDAQDVIAGAVTQHVIQQVGKTVTNPLTGKTYTYGQRGKKPEWVVSLEKDAKHHPECHPTKVVGDVTTHVAPVVKVIKADFAPKAKEGKTVTNKETGESYTYGKRGRKPLWVMALEK